MKATASRTNVCPSNPTASLTVGANGTIQWLRGSYCAKNDGSITGFTTQVGSGATITVTPVTGGNAYIAKATCGGVVSYSDIVRIQYTSNCTGIWFCTAAENTSKTNLVNEEISFAVKAYPNPTTGTFMLDISSPGEKTIAISLFDILGKEVYSKKLTVVEGRQQINMDITNQAKGIYTLKVIGGEETTFYKIVRE